MKTTGEYYIKLSILLITIIYFAYRVYKQIKMYGYHS